MRELAGTFHRLPSPGFVLLELLVAFAVLAVASLPVARTLAAGIERAGRASRLRAAADVARAIANGSTPIPGPQWSRAGSTSEGLPCWARTARPAAADVAWIWLEVVCRRQAPGQGAGEDPVARPVRLLLAAPSEEGSA